MTGFFDYLDWRGDLSLSKSPFCAVDAALLARLSYLPWERLLEGEEVFSLTLGEAGALLQRQREAPLRILDERDPAFLSALGASKRFGGLRLSDWRASFDRESQTQFAALSLNLGTHGTAIAFRGTDSTLAGWQENFNMGYLFPVPAQREAARFLSSVAEKTDGRLFLCGHSKGGNLAVYAATYAEPSVQKRVRQVYNFDGPGFTRRVLDTPEYRAVRSRVQVFVPQSSVIGRLLEREDRYTIVRSDRTGLMQHDLYSWEVRGSRFVTLETVTDSSRYFNRTLRTWIEGMDLAQREAFVESVYTLLSGVNADTLREMGENWRDNVPAVLRGFRHLPPESKKVLSQAVSLLMQSAKTSAEFVGGRRLNASAAE